VPVRDPVCGTIVEEGNLTPSCTHLGEQFFFCCEDCRQAFEKDPSRYMAAYRRQDEGGPEPEDPAA